MKKTLIFSNSNETYELLDGDRIILTIDDNLSINTKDIYDHLFRGINETLDLYFENHIETTSDSVKSQGAFIYDNLKQLLTEIAIEVNMIISSK